MDLHRRLNEAVLRGVVAVLVLAVVASGVALAAGETAMGVTPESATVDVGERTQVEIVLQSADDGVGSIDLEVGYDDSVLDVVGVDVAGQPAYEDQQNGSGTLRVVASGMNTENTGPVTVVTVTVEATAAGDSPLELTAGTVGDENSRSYTVTETNDGAVTVRASDTKTETDTTESPTDEETERSEESQDGNTGDSSDGDDDSVGGGGGLSAPSGGGDGGDDQPTQTTTTDGEEVRSSATATTDELPSPESATSQSPTTATGPKTTDAESSPESEAAGGGGPAPPNADDGTDILGLELFAILGLVALLGAGGLLVLRR